MLFEFECEATASQYVCPVQRCVGPLPTYYHAPFHIKLMMEPGNWNVKNLAVVMRDFELRAAITDKIIILT